MKRKLAVFVLMSLWLSSPGWARLKAGASQVEISPPIGTPLCGYGDRLGRPCTGIHDPLFAKCLVLDNAGQRLAIVSCDLCIMDKALKEKALALLPKDLGLTAENVLVCATHTHAAQGGYTWFRLARIATGRYMPELVEDMSKKIAQSLQEACAGLSDARIGWGRTQDDRLGVNRAVDGGPTDPEIGVLRVDREDGTRIGVVTNLSAHPTTMGGDNMEASAEWPGVYSRAVSQSWGGVALFVNGSEGNQRPGNPTNGSGWDRVEAMGQALANDVLALLPTLTTVSEVRLKAAAESVPFKSAVAGMLSDPVAFCQTFEIGETLWMALPGETCVEIGTRLKEGAKSVGYQVAFVVSCANDHLGYLVPYEYHIQHPEFYETTMCFTGPRTDDMFVRTFARLSPRPFAGPAERPRPEAASVVPQGTMKFMKLSGSPYEMGYAHGKAMAQAISELFGSIITEAKRMAPEFIEGPLGAILGLEWLDPTPLFLAGSGLASRQFLPMIPEELVEEMEGLADGAGISFDEALAFNSFLTLAEQGSLKNLLSIPSCSNVVAFDAATPGGQLIVGRNLDWEFAGVLSKYGMVTLYEPSEGHRFFSVGWPGHCGTLTAMNDVGLTITEESVAAPQDTGLKGLPIMFLIRKVAQYASSVDEAVAMIKSTPGTCGYHITVADGRQKVARVVEVTATHQAVRIPVEGILLGCAPSQVTPEFFEGELPAPEISRTDGSSTRRYQRIDELCQQNRGRIDVTVMQGIMSDRREDVQGMGNVFNEDTAQSVVFLPEQGKMWVAQGEKPGPASGFTEFSF